MSSLVKRGVKKIKRAAVRTVMPLRSPLRVGIIGFGGIAPDHVAAYEDSGIAVIAGISDLVPANLARALNGCASARAYLCYQRMLNEVRPDVVSICTWPQSHADIVEDAAKSGVRGILCEKPLAITVADLQRIQSACERYHVKAAGGHQYRFHTPFMRAADAVRSGMLGAIKIVRGSIKGTLANNGPHLFDTIRYVIGDRAAYEVVCQCKRDRGDFNRGLAAEESATGVVQFSDGIECQFISGDASPEFFRVIIDGTAGSLEVTPQVLKLNGRAVGVEASAELCRRRQFSEFLAWVKGRQAAYSTELDQARQTTELVLACYESARVQMPVRMPLLNDGDVISQCFSDDAAPARSEARRPGEVEAVESGGLAMHGGSRAVKRWFKVTPRLGGPELINVTKVILSKRLSCTDGRTVSELERAFARFYGAGCAVASTSGTAAIHVALGALNLNPGDEVITTPMTDMGTVIPILASNCLPVFADVDPVTGNLTAKSIEQRITPRTRAVILVHLFGWPADPVRISKMLRAKGISLIEDCSQAHAAEYAGQKVGTFGDFGCFSLQQSKQITCGDGGITLVNRADLAERAALFVDKGWDRKRGVRAHLFLGMNYRMTELQGAVALAQLNRLPSLIKSRRQAAEDLSHLLSGIPGIILPSNDGDQKSSWWMYTFRIDEERLGTSTDRVADALLVEGVRIRRRYLPEPIFEYEMLKRQNTYGSSRYPFSAFPYTPPIVSDFSGLQEFNDRLLFFSWSHDVRPKHTKSIAEAIKKVTTVLRKGGSSRCSLVNELAVSRT